MMAVPKGIGNVAFGTFVTDNNETSITLPDCIGKKNILVYPLFDFAVGDIVDRVHWGTMIIDGRCLMKASTNTGKNGYAFSATFDNSTGSVTNSDQFDPETGTLTIIGRDLNGAGYFIAGYTYGYIAWG